MGSYCAKADATNFHKYAKKRVQCQMDYPNGLPYELKTFIGD